MRRRCRRRARSSRATSTPRPRGAARPRVRGAGDGAGSAAESCTLKVTARAPLRRRIRGTRVLDQLVAQGVAGLGVTGAPDQGDDLLHVGAPRARQSRSGSGVTVRCTRVGRHPAGPVDVEDLVEPAEGQPRADAQGQVDQLVVAVGGVAGGPRTSASMRTWSVAKRRRTRRPGARARSAPSRRRTRPPRRRPRAPRRAPPRGTARRGRCASPGTVAQSLIRAMVIRAASNSRSDSFEFS